MRCKVFFYQWFNDNNGGLMLKYKRLNHKHLIIRMKKKVFGRLLEEIRRENQQ